MGEHLCYMHSNSQSPKACTMPIYAVIAALVVASCWGGNFAASKFALQDFPPFLTVLLRFIAVSTILAPFAMRQKLPNLKDMFIISITLVVIHFAFIFVSMEMGLNVTSAIVATQMGVPFSCLVSAIMFKDYLGPWRSFGLMVAFIGVVIVAGSPNASEHWAAFLLAMVGAFSWSMANIYLKRLPTMPVVTLVFWPGLIAMPFLIAISLIFESGQLEAVQNAHWTSWAGITYSTFFSSLLGYGLWNWLISRYPLSHVSPYTLFAPIVGISAGAFFFDDPLTAQIIGGSILTIIGVGIITLRRPRLVTLERD